MKLADRLIPLLLVIAACGGPGHVEFNQGKCLIDAQPANIQEVESRQAKISERIISRQPMFVLVTVLIVLLAGASHLEKVVLLFSTRRQESHGLSQRLRVALERYRDRPLRYFSIVVSTLLLMGIAGGFYVYLDADKRASERALGLLQFCHLALRNGEAEGILTEQRHNLETIESTAGSIRALVKKLPPEEQEKAKEIVSQINSALSRQGKLVNEFLAQTTESNKSVVAHTQVLEKGLSTLETNILDLKPLPQGLRDLTEQLRALDGKQTSAEAKLVALKGAVDALAARPDVKCPACICESQRATPPDAGGSSH